MDLNEFDVCNVLLHFFLLVICSSTCVNHLVFIHNTSNKKHKYEYNNCRIFSYYCNPVLYQFRLYFVVLARPHLCNPRARNNPCFSCFFFFYFKTRVQFGGTTVPQTHFTNLCG